MKMLVTSIFSFSQLKENILEKGEIAQNEQFHIFPQHFLCNLYLNPFPNDKF